MTIKPTGRIYICGKGAVGPFGTARTSFQVRQGKFQEAVPELSRLKGLVEGRGGQLYPKQQIVHGKRLPAPSELRGIPLKQADFERLYSHEVDRRIGIRVVLPGDTETNLDPQRYQLDSGQIVSLKVIHAGAPPHGWDLREEGGFKKGEYAELEPIHLAMMRALSEALIDTGRPWEEIDRAVPSELRTVGAASGDSPGGANERLILNTAKGRSVGKWPIAKKLPNILPYYLARALGAESLSCRVAACNTGIANLEDVYKRMVNEGMLLGAVATFESALIASSFEGFFGQNALATNQAVALSGGHPSLISKPGLANRPGFVMGWGGALLILADAALADELKMIKYAEVVSVETATGPRGKIDPAVPTSGVDIALRRSSKKAAEKLGMSPEELAANLFAIEAHGTGTDVGDSNAVRAYQKYLAELGRDPSDPAFMLYAKGGPRLRGIESARKVGGIGKGHLLGGAGSDALVEATQVLDEAVIPPSVESLESVDPDFHAADRLMFPTTPLAIDFDDSRPVLMEVDSQAFGDDNGSAWLRRVPPSENQGREASRAWRDGQFAKIEGGEAKPVDYIGRLAGEKE